MKNKLTDLNDILFAQLERLTADDLAGEAMAAEVQRTAAVVQLADRIVDGARLQLDGAQFLAAHGGKPAAALPAALGIGPTGRAGGAS